MGRSQMVAGKGQDKYSMCRKETLTESMRRLSNIVNEAEQLNEDPKKWAADALQDAGKEVAKTVGGLAGTVLKRKKIIWTPDKVEELKTLYAEGNTMSVIAQHFNITVPAVSAKIQKLKREGLWPIGNRRTMISWTTDQVKELKKLYVQDKSIAEISKALNVSEQVITSKIQNLKNKGELKGRTIKWTDETNQLLIDLLSKGYTAEKIATELGTTTGAVYARLHRLKLTGTGRNQMTLKSAFKGTTFSEFLGLGGFNLKIGVAPQEKTAFLEWLDNKFLPTLQGQHLFKRMIDLDTAMLEANHIRYDVGRGALLIKTRKNDLKNRRYARYKWDEVDKLSTISEQKLAELKKEYELITSEMQKLLRQDYTLIRRITAQRGFGFLSGNTWQHTVTDPITKQPIDTFEKWQQVQKDHFPDFLDKLDEFEDEVNRLVVERNPSTGQHRKAALLSIKNKIKMLGNPPDLVAKKRELETIFNDIRIKAGADFEIIRKNLPSWYIHELNTVDSFKNLPFFGSKGNTWNIDHAGTDNRNIDIHFSLNNKVVGGAEVKRTWRARFGSLTILISKDDPSKIFSPRPPTTELAKLANKLIDEKINLEIYNGILKKLETVRQVRIDLTETITVGEYVKNFYAVKDNGNAKFLVVGEEIFRLADLNQIPKELADFPRLNEMSGIEDMQGKIIFESVIKNGKISHGVRISGHVPQTINSINLNELLTK
jgi:hypothetical protein